MSASWCAPCFSSIDIIDDLEEYWSDENSNVKFVTALSDIGEPYSCEEWGIEGVIGSPLIVEDDGTFFSWFQDSNGQYPSYVLIDHTMTVRAKPSNMFSNSNDNSCDGSEYMDSLDSDCLNSMITDLLDECGDGCSSGAGCSDESACNDGDNTDCIYAQENYDCCGECIAEVDCLGVCGGDATDEECASSTGECNLPTCHLVSLDSEIYSTIQSGIDAAVDGDTVLVEQGTYYENLLLDKEITLTSRAIFDDLNGWIGYGDSYVILNNNITGTIIDGSEDTDGDDRQSTILINSPDECIEPTIFGFTITGGNGTNVVIRQDPDTGDNIFGFVGGGILSNNALPKINYNFITNNSGDDLESGGAVQQTTDVDFPALMHLESGNLRCEGDVDLSFNFYRDNDALYGNTLGTEEFAGSLDMSNSIFDIYNCPDEEVSPVWVYVDEEVDVDFDNGVGDLCSITEDVYVSPSGDDNNLGTSESEAFLTIGRALEMIAPQDDDPVTINLTDSTFAPSTTGETFPIIMISNVNLIGQGEEVTIIDAQQTSRVIIMENCNNNIISDLTITGGNTGPFGGGMYLGSSNPTLTHVTISGNVAGGGGGMYLGSSNPTLTHVTISGNEGLFYGGGMFLNSSNPILTNVTIANNTAYFSNFFVSSRGGGMHLDFSNPTLNHVTITDNTASEDGGGMNLWDSNPNLTNVTISNNTAEYGGGMFLNSSNPILTNVTISNNTADNGGGMNLWDSNPMLTHVTIANNTAYSGGGIYLYSFSNPTLTNSIIWDNSPESILYDEYYDESIITFSDIEGGWEGEGNISIDPEFTDHEYSDYTLREGSPCIDAGIVVEEMEYCGSAPDMGAYEYGSSSMLSIDLHVGANLVAFSILPEDNSIDNLLSSLGENILGLLGAGQSAVYNDGEWIGSLTNLEYESGYWFIVNESSSLTISGSMVSPNLSYGLLPGVNLISYSQSECGFISEVLPDTTENCIYAIMAEGVSALNTEFGWSGSLQSLCPNKGYWFVNSCSELEFAYEAPTTLARENSKQISPHPYHQSTKQAFYFIEDIENIQLGDWVLAYQGETLIGARQWQGENTDIPVMGNDGSEFTAGYIHEGFIPQFKILRNGSFIDLGGDIPPYSINEVFVVSSLFENNALPQAFSLGKAYPNPFNPTTTINFATPINGEVSIAIYDLQGRETALLIKGNLKAGYHSVMWDAANYSSGVYFVKMIVGEYISTQKLMLVK